MRGEHVFFRVSVASNGFLSGKSNKSIFFWLASAWKELDLNVLSAMPSISLECFNSLRWLLKN